MPLLNDIPATIGLERPDLQGERGKKKGRPVDPSPCQVKRFLCKISFRVIQLDNPLLIVRFYSAATAIMSTETYLRPSLPAWNRTRPAVSANKV